MRIGAGGLLDQRHQRVLGRERQRRQRVQRLEGEAGGGIDAVHPALDRLAGVALQAAEFGVGVVAGDGAPLHLESGLLGNDVQDRAALDEPRVDRAVRRLEAVLTAALPLQAPGLGGDPGNCLCGGMDRVDPVRRHAGMAGLAAHRDAHGQASLVRRDRLHARRLADDAERRLQAAGLEVAHQNPGSLAIHLLVVGDEQVHRPLQRQRLQVRHRGQAGGDEPLHIDGAARVQPSVVAGEPERIGAPGLAIDRDGVDMAGQGEAACDLGADDGVQVRLLAALVMGEAVGDALPVEIGTNPVDQRQVRPAARRVECDQRLQDLRRAHLVCDSHLVSLYGATGAAMVSVPGGRGCRHLGTLPF